jgi:hypothetical protein
MITKTLLATTAALVLAATSFVSVAEAQRAPRQHESVQPFTDAERNWFEIPQGRDGGMPRH